MHLVDVCNICADHNIELWTNHAAVADKHFVHLRFDIYVSLGMEKTRSSERLGQSGFQTGLERPLKVKVKNRDIAAVGMTGDKQ